MQDSARARVWDAPVRVTHWLLAACIAIAWLTRGARYLDLHLAAGYCALLLLAFRLAWGFLGTRHARFADFRYSPRQAWLYLREAWRGAPRHFTGHNPAGSWAVYALLALIGANVLSGLLALAGMHGLGPVPFTLPFSTTDAARAWHEALAWSLLGLVALHVAGVAWGSRVHRENLVASMVSGYKRRHGPDAAQAPARLGVALVLLFSLALLAAGYLVSSGWLHGYPRGAATVATPASGALASWNRECGGCHLAYSPALLPPRSWQAMLEKQDDHFGEDLALSRLAVGNLQGAMRQDPPSWAAWKLARSAAALPAATLRISDTPYWREAHRHLDEREFARPFAAGRHDCETCHRDAASGIFAPRLITKKQAGSPS
jgi:cytochrome b